MKLLARASCSSTFKGMRAWLGLAVPVCLGALTLAFGCSPASGSKAYNQGSGGSGSVGGGNAGTLNVGPDTPDTPDIGCDPSEPGSPCSPDAPATAGCGDGVLTEDEACDDGNTTAGDGCQANCLAVDPGFSCNPPGQPCHELVVCGDSIVGSSEQCDDGNTAAGDGCSARCNFELGFRCEGEPSACMATECGDGKQEGAESCDDGNDQPFDGCSSLCQTEPTCSGSGCTSDCGDGLVIDEECDDGNAKDGDGCSHECKKEPGFECSQDADCEKIDGECVLRVPAVFRDFNAKDSPNGHPDFQVTCGGEQVTTGLLKPDLDAAGKPQLVAPGAQCITSEASFKQWYTDSDKSHAVVGDVVLFKKAMGTGFVNRWGALGEQWTALTNEQWAANTYAECQASGCTPCSYNPSQGCRGTPVAFDGTPFFFPLDNAAGALTDARFEATVGPDYGYPNWPWEKALVPGAGKHNFHFTTEVKYWFQYQAESEPTLDFTGDDDVWVFVNGKLAVDIGGVHPPKSGSVTLDTATATRLGLTDGKVYAISIFHAERKTDGSSFRLTLDGFNTARSDCSPICGDGVVSLGEQCDDGVNDGGYGECADGCVLGAYCGDGIKQAGEYCDDGNRIDGDGCSAACRNIVVK
jgi:fibro-slime domain-containing protein